MVEESEFAFCTFINKTRMIMLKNKQLLWSEITFPKLLHGKDIIALQCARQWAFSNVCSPKWLILIAKCNYICGLLKVKLQWTKNATFNSLQARHSSKSYHTHAQKMSQEWSPADEPWILFCSSLVKIVFENNFSVKELPWSCPCIKLNQILLLFK